MEKKFNRQGPPRHIYTSSFVVFYQGLAVLCLGWGVAQVVLWSSEAWHQPHTPAALSLRESRGWNKHPLWPSSFWVGDVLLFLLQGHDRKGRLCFYSTIFSLFQELLPATDTSQSSRSLGMAPGLFSGLCPMGSEPVISEFIAAFLSSPTPVSFPLIFAQRSLDNVTLTLSHCYILSPWLVTFMGQVLEG